MAARAITATTPHLFHPPIFVRPAKLCGSADSKNVLLHFQELTISQCSRGRVARSCPQQSSLHACCRRKCVDANVSTLSFKRRSRSNDQRCSPSRSRIAVCAPPRHTRTRVACACSAPHAVLRACSVRAVASRAKLPRALPVCAQLNMVLSDITNTAHTAAPEEHRSGSNRRSGPSLAPAGQSSSFPPSYIDH